MIPGAHIGGAVKISSDGRFVGFTSDANNLVPSDTNGVRDVFVHDLETGATERVSVATDGTEADDDSFHPQLSADGQQVAFRTWAGNLVPGDTNDASDVFVHDRAAGTTTRVSVASDGAESNGFSSTPAISTDGRHVAFVSVASNLVAGDANGESDVFVHDRATQTTTRVSVASDGTEGNDISNRPALSHDGRYVAFNSFADNLVAGDTNGFLDVFVHDRGAPFAGEIAAINDLAETVAEMDLPQGTATSVGAKLETARAKLEAGDVASACGALNALTNQARAQSGRHLTPEQADAIIAAAEALMAELDC